MPRHWSDPGFASPADLAACRALLRQGSKSFHIASLLLPDRVREPAVALYAFCRVADDAVDLAGGPHAALDGLRARLERIYGGRPAPRPVDRAFADVVARFSIPRPLPEALFEGFAWDAAGRRYEELDEVLSYAARVAGTVGAMMTLLMGERTPAVIARACDLGVAMQLSNIARDVGEDARAGRLYLPRRWLRAAGIDPDAWLAAPAFSPALGEVVGRLLATAEGLYLRADAGIGRLPPACRPGIAAARRLYAEIGRELARSGLDSVAGRTVVPRGRRLVLLAAALADLARPGRDASAPPLPATKFLVDAVAAAPALPGGAPRAAWWQVEHRAVWVVDLFERLARRRGIEGSSAGP